MGRTELGAGANYERYWYRSTLRRNHRSTLVDDCQNSGRAQGKQILIYFSENRFRQAVVQVDSAVRMRKVVRIVMLEEWRESDALDVDVSIAQESSSSRTESWTETIAAIFVGIHRYGALPGKIFARLCNSECQRSQQLLLKLRRQLI